MMYQEDLDGLTCQCGQPGCEGALFLHSRCHLDAHLDAKYFNGVLTLTCAKCDKLIAEISVAREPDERELASRIKADAAYVGRIDKAQEEADDAFWAVIARHFPEAKTGDFPPEATEHLRLTEVAAIMYWLILNTPS